MLLLPMKAGINFEYRSAWEQWVRPERSVSESSSSHCSCWHRNEKSLVHNLNAFILILFTKSKLCLNVAKWVCTKSGGAGWKLWHAERVVACHWGAGDRTGAFVSVHIFSWRERSKVWELTGWCSVFTLTNTCISMDVKFPNKLLVMYKNKQSNAYGLIRAYIYFGMCLLKSGSCFVTNNELFLILVVCVVIF